MTKPSGCPCDTSLQGSGLSLGVRGSGFRGRGGRGREVRARYKKKRGVHWRPPASHALAPRLVRLRPFNVTFSTPGGPVNDRGYGVSVRYDPPLPLTPCWGGRRPADGGLRCERERGHPGVTCHDTLFSQAPRKEARSLSPFCRRVLW